MIYYPLRIINNFSFQFNTEQGLLYSVYFVDYSSMFYQFPHIASSIYSFNIDVIEGDANQSLNDERIGSTIAEIFKLFFY